MSKKDNFKYLSHDIVAKYIFGTNENKKFTKRLLELFFDKEIDDIEILNSVKLTPNNIKTKSLEMDILINIPCLNTKVILEVQNKLNMNTLTKNIVYLFSQVPKEFKKGDKNFLNSSSLMEINLVKHICEDLRNIEDKYSMTGAIKRLEIAGNLAKVFIIDIENCGVKCYNKKEIEQKMWYELIKAETQNELDEIRRKSKEFQLIREVIKKMEEFNGDLYGNDYWLNDVLARSEYASGYNKGEADGYNRGEADGYNRGEADGYNRGEADGYNRGETVGYNEGINKRNYEIASNLLEKTNTPIEEICDCTGLSLNEVKELKRKVNALIKK